MTIGSLYQHSHSDNIFRIQISTSLCLYVNAYAEFIYVSEIPIYKNCFWIDVK